MSCAGIHDAKRIVTPYWLNEVIKRKEHFPPCEAIHFPVNFPPTRSVLQGKIMSACGFTVEEREKLKIMFYTLGVKYSPAFSQSCFALICKSLNNEKVKRAQEWSIPIYNVEYLSDLLLRGKIAVENASSPVYQNFDKSDPFKLDVTTYKELYRFIFDPFCSHIPDLFTGNVTAGFLPIHTFCHLGKMCLDEA